ncbi:MAG TPA: MBL fold metallo-hydrolase, partial [Verrucomicrobiae bacterium]|nr:MBL fold metallo-hydrolase [Verrucomicrobiae bacterium]
MNLEDHLGDVIRKARAMSGVAASAAASAAQISETDLSSLEEAGKSDAKINFAALGKALGLHPQKLEALASGWLPAQKDLSAWREIRVFSSSGEGLTVNCYLVWDEVTRDAALFDTGLDANPILDCITAEQLQLRHIFITHSHWDHVEALPK